jgi:hypothetical protein
VVQAEWVDPADQLWLARWARAWVTDPGHKFMKAETPNEFERELLGLFDSMEGLHSDIDERIEKLHQLWKHSNFLTKSWYRLKVPYLLRGAGYEVSERARKMKTRSATQMLANWGRISTIVNAQNGGDWMVSKAWIGPVTEKQGPEATLAAPSWGPPIEKPDATLAAPSWGPALAPATWGPAAEEKPSWLRRAMGEWIDMGNGRYMSASGRGYTEGPLARLIYGKISRKPEARGQDSAAESDIGHTG